MAEKLVENLNFLHSQIYGVHFSHDKFFASSDKTEGKFIIYRKNDRIKLYGLLWSDDSVQRKNISGDWYDFDMGKIDYHELIPWIHRVKCQYQFYSKEFSKTFDINEELLGGGFLTMDLEKMIWRTFHDRDFQRAPLNIIQKCFEKESKIMKIEVLDEINVRMFRYESVRH